MELISLLSLKVIYLLESERFKVSLFTKDGDDKDGDDTTTTTTNNNNNNDNNNNNNNKIINVAD